LIDSLTRMTAIGKRSDAEIKRAVTTSIRLDGTHFALPMP
jgi:hypothetical protein